VEEQIESIKNQISELSMNGQGKRHYTKSIKSAIRKLHGDGMSFKMIAEKTGIHFTTLHGWFATPKPKTAFREIKVESKLESQEAIIEITFPSGAKVFGLGFADFVQVLKQGLIK
jgi:hypothetical protein